MNFTEFDFWPRLLVCLAFIMAARRLVPKQARLLSLYDRVALGCLSFYLLACVGMLTFTIFLSVFSLAWVLLSLLAVVEARFKPWILWIGIPLLLTPLFYYKYRYFVAGELLGMEMGAVAGVMIPAGISFYSFQKVAMVVDASRLKGWKPQFIDYLNFASFFPQVVAGPIERKEFLFPQMERFSFECTWQRFNAGAPWLAIGFFYKLCIADNLSGFLRPDLVDSAWPIVFTTFLFGLKIYFDFCGYSLIALGLAKCVGINITLNFRSPYWSTSIREFWRRWHISLSYWFRDYVYIPLGGSKNGSWAFNLLVVFLISGIWHGAGWGFVIWGGLHGLFCIVSHYFHRRVTLPSWLGWSITSLCVFISWLPFYETRMGLLWQKVQTVAIPSAWSWNALSAFALSYSEADRVALVAMVGLCGLVMALEGLCRLRQRDDYSFAAHPVMIMVLVLGVVILGASEGNEFVYFAF